MFFANENILNNKLKNMFLEILHVFSKFKRNKTQPE